LSILNWLSLSKSMFPWASLISDGNRWQISSALKQMAQIFIVKCFTKSLLNKTMA